MGLTLGSGPARDLASEVDADDLGALELPRQIRHNVHSVRASHTARNHTQPTRVGRVRVGTNHQSTREGIVLQDDLMDDSGTRLPESDTVFGGGGGKEVVHLLVDGDGASQVLDASNLGFDEMVAMDGRGDGGGGHAGGHELENGHLGTMISGM